MKERPHAELIRAWADGAQIQYKKYNRDEWEDTSNPAFVEDYEYRIKPEAPVRTYPETKLTEGDIEQIYLRHDGPCIPSIVATVNAALRHACDNGQVVTREEFDRALGERKARDMEIAKHVRHKCYTSSQQVIGKLDLAAIIAEVKP